MADHRKPMSGLQKDDFVDLIRQGHLRYESARQLDLTVRQIEYAYKNDPDFRADLDDALMAANEPVENALYEAAKAGEPWATKIWLERRDKERWGPAPVKVQITHELDGSALLESVAGLAAELEQRRLHATSIATGGQVIEYEPVRRYEHPVVYELGKAPRMTNPVIKKMRDTHGIARRLPEDMLENVTSPLLNDLPRRPGT